MTVTGMYRTGSVEALRERRHASMLPKAATFAVSAFYGRLGQASIHDSVCDRVTNGRQLVTVSV